MNNKIIAVIVVLVLIVAGFLLFKGDTKAPIINTYTNGALNETASTSNTSTQPEASVKEFTVTGSSFNFSPKVITVKKGDTVKINFVNSGGMHDWRIDEFNASTKVINGGQTDSVTFLADKAGSFEYYCSVGTHRQMGMKGTLIVE
jgi:plastocyanin